LLDFSNNEVKLKKKEDKMNFSISTFFYIIKNLIA